MEKQANKPQKGFWGTLKNDRTPKVMFEVGKSQMVTLLCDEPREDESIDGDSVYYTFDVLHEGKNTVIQTSAFTLLAELKKHEPLKGKVLVITKVMEKGKQSFKVETP